VLFDTSHTCTLKLSVYNCSSRIHYYWVLNVLEPTWNVFDAMIIDLQKSNNDVDVVNFFHACFRLQFTVKPIFFVCPLFRKFCNLGDL